jgi:hypothetical protein
LYQRAVDQDEDNAPCKLSQRGESRGRSNDRQQAANRDNSQHGGDADRLAHAEGCDTAEQQKERDGDQQVWHGDEDGEIACGSMRDGGRSDKCDGEHECACDERKAI